MEFWDREREIEYLKRYIQSEPNAILFVYGPKSSGKSTLLMEVIDRLMEKEKFSQSHIVYWFDLRGTLVSNYENVVDLFFVDEESAQKLDKTFRFGINMFITAEVEVKELMKEKRLDPFRYMENVLREKERTGVIVFDELQKLKDVYLNSPNNQRPLVKELFNFFVRLTKVLHLSHVIVMTSDTFFIERVYTDSTLENTSLFYLVDYFDDETTYKILKDHGFSDEDSQYVIDWIGGVPWMIERIVIEKSTSVIETLYETTKTSIMEKLGTIYENDPQMVEDAKNLMSRLLKGDLIDLYGKDRKILKELVGMEILFFDPVKGRVRYQTKLHERAVKELLGVD